MPGDWNRLLLDPIYQNPLIGRDVRLHLEGGAEHALRGIEASEQESVGDNVEVPSIVPAVLLRTHELADRGLQPRDLLGAALSINGVWWQVLNTQPDPTPGGQREGEIKCTLYQDPEAPAPPTEPPTEVVSEPPTEPPVTEPPTEPPATETEPVGALDYSRTDGSQYVPLIF